MHTLLLYIYALDSRESARTCAEPEHLTERTITPSARAE